MILGLAGGGGEVLYPCAGAAAGIAAQAGEGRPGPCHGFTGAVGRLKKATFF